MAAPRPDRKAGGPGVRSWLGLGPWTWLVVDALAVHRLSRLTARDTVFAPARRWLADRADPQRFTGVLVRPLGVLLHGITCMWCVSIWFAAVVTILTWWQPYAWSVAASVLALSTVAGWLGGKE